MDIVVSIAILSAAVAGCVAVGEFGVKVWGEVRLQKGAACEIDIRMSKLFTELMWVAHARGGSHVSEKAMESLFEKGMINESDCGDLKVLHDKLQACVVNLPVGLASQTAAIASIAVLGHEYAILYEPALAALNTFKSSFEEEVIRREAEKALEILARRN
jgi:hypothetical protein